MGIKSFLSEYPFIQTAMSFSSWIEMIEVVAEPLIAGGFITIGYSQEMIRNTQKYGAYYIIGEGVAIPHARPECGVIKNCFSLATLKEPISIIGSEPVDIIVMFGGVDSNSHITEGIASILALLDDEDSLIKLRAATSVNEVLRLL